MPVRAGQAGTPSSSQPLVTAAGVPAVLVITARPQGSWYTLLDILNEARAEAADERSRPFVACPNDGEPLLAGPRGELYCPFDGWRPGVSGSPGGWF